MLGTVQDPNVRLGRVGGLALILCKNNDQPPIFWRSQHKQKPAVQSFETSHFMSSCRSPAVCKKTQHKGFPVSLRWKVLCHLLAPADFSVPQVVQQAIQGLTVRLLHESTKLSWTPNTCKGMQTNNGNLWFSTLLGPRFVGRTYDWH